MMEVTDEALLGFAESVLSPPYSFRFAKSFKFLFTFSDKIDEKSVPFLLKLHWDSAFYNFFVKFIGILRPF